MRCLYCGEKLSLLKKLASSNFCSSEHEKNFRKERDQVGLARLLDARADLHGTSAAPELTAPLVEQTDSEAEPIGTAPHTRPLPVVAAASYVIETIQARTAEIPGLLQSEFAPVAWGVSSWCLTSPITLSRPSELRAARGVAPPIRTRNYAAQLLGTWAPAAAKLHLLYPSIDSRAAVGGIPLATLLAINWLTRSQPAPLERVITAESRSPQFRMPAAPLRTLCESFVAAERPAFGDLVSLPGPQPRTAAFSTRSAVEFVPWLSAESRAADYAARPALRMRPVGFVGSAAETIEPPRVESVLPLQTRTVEPTIETMPQVLMPAPTSFHPSLPRRSAPSAPLFELNSALLTSLPTWPVLQHANAGIGVEASLMLLAPSLPEAAVSQSATTAPSLAALTALPVRISSQSPKPAAVAPLLWRTEPVMTMALRSAAGMVRLASLTTLPVRAATATSTRPPVQVTSSTPVQPRTLPLNVKVSAPAPKPASGPLHLAMPDPRPTPWPAATVESLVCERTPILPRLKEGTDGTFTPVGSPFGRRTAFTPVIALWHKMPAEAKWAALALPLILGLWLRPESKKPVATAQAEPQEATSSTKVQKVSLDRMLDGPLQSIRKNISRRAAVEFHDDFRAGLSNWDGVADWSRTWAYDPSGFVRTGLLSLYQPTISLKDYRLDFVGQIEKRALGWALRAQDLKNYYAFKIIITKPGPLPTAVLERYAVINGKEDRHVQMPLPLSVRNDTIYNVRVDVYGSEYTTFVQDQIIDSWTDERLKTGGVGFFSAKGEVARLRGVAVSHQYDALGRLCAYLVPSGIQTNNGSVKQ